MKTTTQKITGTILIGILVITLTGCLSNFEKRKLNFESRVQIKIDVMRIKEHSYREAGLYQDANRFNRKIKGLLEIQQYIQCIQHYSDQEQRLDDLEFMYRHIALVD